MKNGRTGTNAAVDIKVASSKKADSGSEKASSGSKKADSGKAFAKALSLLLSIALLLSLAACVGTEGEQTGSGDDAEQPIDGDTPPEGDADPTGDGTAPTGDGTTEGEEGCDNENENPDNRENEPSNDYCGDSETFIVNGEEVSEDYYLAQKIDDLENYRKEFSYIDESGEKSIEEIAEILYSMLFAETRSKNEDLAFIIIEGKLAEITIIDTDIIALESENKNDENDYGWTQIFPKISENCWGTSCGIIVEAFAGQLWPLSTGSLTTVHTADDYEEGMFSFEGNGTGYRYITRDPLTNEYTLSLPVSTPS